MRAAVKPMRLTLVGLGRAVSASTLGFGCGAEFPGSLGFVGLCVDRMPEGLGGEALQISFLL